MSEGRNHGWDRVGRGRRLGPDPRLNGEEQEGRDGAAKWREVEAKAPIRCTQNSPELCSLLERFRTVPEYRTRVCS